MLIKVSPEIAVNPDEVASIRLISKDTVRITMKSSEVLEAYFDYGPDAMDTMDTILRSATPEPKPVETSTPQPQCENDKNCVLPNGHKGDCDRIPF